jgi:hypothetical protein
MAAARSGGGWSSNKRVDLPQPKREPISHAVSPGAVSRQGAVVGEGTPHKSLYSGAGYSTPRGPSDGMDCRVGGNNREILKSGSQSQHGSAVGGTPRPGSDRQIFPGFPGRR